MIASRDSFFDVVKCMLIILVVFGHTLENDNGIVKDTLYPFIYSFHMPLFIFISGYFTNVCQSRKDFFKRNFRLLETFIVFQTIFIAINILYGKPFHWYMLYVPQWGLWYLLSLFWWRTLIVFINPQKYRTYICIIISLLLCILSGYVDFTRGFSFQRTFYFFPFFMAGHCIATKKIDIKSYFLSFKTSISILLCTLSVCYVISRIKEISIIDLLYATYSYDTTISSISFLGFKNLIFARIITLFLSFLISYAFLSICQHIKAKNYMLSIGKNTLYFYIYHLLILFFFNKIISAVDLPTTLPFIILYTTVIVIGLYKLSNNKVLIKSLNPITSRYKL